MRREEPEPLAFRVKPFPVECFDSWLDRVAARHEVDRARLFRHLDIEVRLALIDLAPGATGLDKQLSANFDQMVARLAWAVEIDAAAVWATFVSARPEWLLPPAMRRYGCARCWLERLGHGEPTVIDREWIFRLSWYCDHHHVLLADLAPVMGVAGRHARLCWLLHEAGRCRALFNRERHRGDMLALNRAARTHLQGPSGTGRRPELGAYMSEFGANQLHVATSRTMLLAHAHSYDSHGPRRFAKLFGALACPGTAPVPRPALSVTRDGLARAIARVHLGRLRHKARKLEAVAQRLGRFAYLCGERHVRWQQAARHRLMQECRRRRSLTESLHSLETASRLVEEAHGRRRWTDWARPSNYPAAWPEIPSPAQLRRLIAAREARLKTVAPEA